MKHLVTYTVDYFDWIYRRTREISIVEYEIRRFDTVRVVDSPKEWLFRLAGDFPKHPNYPNNLHHLELDLMKEIFRLNKSSYFSATKKTIDDHHGLSALMNLTLHHILEKKKKKRFDDDVREKLTG